ncbi:MAG: PAS domain S-box protein [Oscillospiraceae bacterium]|nr:PAS domain S-box protein [Oscillospiraceae bacterium]
MVSEKKAFGKIGKFGISRKIAVLLAALLLFNALATGVFSYAFFKNESVKAYSNTALAIAKSAIIDGDEVSEILREKIKDDVYYALKSQLDRITDQTEAITAYILGAPVFESDGYPLVALSFSDIDIGIVKSADSFAPEAETAFSDGQAVVSGVYEYYDSGGEQIITAFAPLFDRYGNVAGVLGVDISAVLIFSGALSFALCSAVFLTVLFIILSIAAAFLSRRLFGKRLRAVAEVSESMAAGDFENTDRLEFSVVSDEADLTARNLEKIRNSVNALAMGISGFADSETSGLNGIFAVVDEAVRKPMSIVENIDSLVYVSDIETYDLLFANRKLMEVAGLSASEIKSKKCWQVMNKNAPGPCPFCPLPKLLAEKNSGVIQKAPNAKNKGGVYAREHYNRITKRWYWTQGLLIKWAGGKTAHFEMATDITKLKAYETGMKNLSAIISVADAGIIVKDRRGIITEWNIGAQNILGYEREEMLGKTAKDYTSYEWYGDIDAMAARLLKGEHIPHFEEEYTHKDGGIVDCSVSYTPIFDNDTVTGYVSVFHDISEKKRIEKEHQQLENTLFNLFENLSNGFALFELFTSESGGENLKLLMANKAFRKFSNKYNSPDGTGEDLTGLTMTEIYGAALEELSYYINVAKFGGGRNNETYNFTLKINMNEMVFSPSRGQVALLLTDRTNLVAAEEALQKREKDLAMLFGSMTAGFCMGRIIFDEDGKPADVIFEIINQSYETLEDFEPGSLIGKKLSEISSKEWKRYFRIYSDVAINRRKATFTKYIASKEKTLDVVCYSPSENYFACIESDVTERVKKDGELKKAYRDTEAILGEIPAPICAVGRETGVILGCNKAFVKICGANSEDELKGSKIETYLINNNAEHTNESVSKGGKKKNGKDIKKLLGSGEFKGYLNKRDETSAEVEVEVFSKPFVYKDQIAYAVCFIDMTGQKVQEEILREAALSAEETSRLKSMFLANISHEIRTPMNGIIGLTELALDGGGLTEKTADYLEKIRNSATGLLAIVNDVLDISKIEAGKIELEKVEFLFDSVLKSCKSDAVLSNEGKDITLLFNCKELESIKVMGDPTKLRQIFINLLSNALKFTEKGKVELTASVTEKDAQKITVNFAVKDTGIGISEAQINRIFVPFSQADASTTRKYGGTGLGLSITNSLLDLMGGELTVDSKQGEGSTFSFTLTFPLASEKASVSAIANMAQLKSKDKKPVFASEALICEDNAINRQVIEEHLLRIGINPVVAENGKIGLNMVKTRMRTGKPFDIILMDIHMPVMDGMEATRKIIEAGCKTPVIAMTANVMREDKELILGSGMSEYICKPFSARDLWDCLLKFLVPVRFEDILPEGVRKVKTGVIDQQAGLEKAAGDPRLYKKIKSDFYFDNKDIIEKIESAVKDGDFKIAHRLSHTLKGLATLIGANALSEAARELEKSFIEGKADEQTLALTGERLELVLKELLPQAQAYKEAGEKPPSERVTDVVKAGELIKRLEPILNDGNSEALDFIDELKEVISWDLCSELVTYMLDYEFDEAYKALQKIKAHLS